MKVPGKKTLVKISVWLVAEILLNISGLDYLAGYSEFIFERRMELSGNSFAEIFFDNYFSDKNTSLIIFDG